MVGSTEGVRQPAAVPLRLVAIAAGRERSRVIALADRPAVLAAFARARSIALASYILPTGVARRLAGAAARGARVDLSLAERPIAETWQERALLARENRAAGDLVSRPGG